MLRGDNVATVFLRFWLWQPFGLDPYIAFQDILYHTILYHTILCYIISYYMTFYYIILHYIILCYIILYYAILYCITLYDTILYYIILYYITSCYIALNPKPQTLNPKPLRQPWCGGLERWQKMQALLSQAARPNLLVLHYNEVKYSIV